MKDRIIKETLEELLIYYAANSRSMSFPEMTIAPSVLLRKFRKNTTNNDYRKTILTFLDHLKANETLITQKRSNIRDLSSANLDKLHKQLNDAIGKGKKTPLEIESDKLLKRRTE